LVHLIHAIYGGNNFCDGTTVILTAMKEVTMISPTTAVGMALTAMLVVTAIVIAIAVLLGL
jgi:hypothetical protein